ncbi:hypothetical protein Pan97_04490 [Bremerella volcania]|uniref:Uncharacterized protein n=1 Tax=Bremerella volcania TaxID=2527984 RepID=A0A518C2L7_9BACT|nr:hypothetical protein [Bremerella volcania]QDU73477.1 hypothetical protein Pan97_04490 [Bremerella volcania]
MSGPTFGIGIFELVILAAMGGGCLIGVGGLVAFVLLSAKKSNDEK